MAHSIDITDGKASFVSAHTAAWHQLGTVLPDTFTAEEAMLHGHLGGWNVRKVPMLADLGGRTLEVPGMNVIVRDNPVRAGRVDVLSREKGVTDGYQIVQNEEHAEFINAVAHESGASFDTAGALDDGRRVFITMKLPNSTLVGGVDLVDHHLAAINSHDGTMSFTLMVTPIRVVCQNTLNLALANHVNVFRVRHTTNAEKKIRTEARRALDMSFAYIADFEDEARKLIETSLTQTQFEEIVARAFGPAEDAPPRTAARATKRLEEMFALFGARTQDGIHGTAWAGLNALTEWADHFSGVRGGDHDTSRAVKAIKDPAFKNQAMALMLTTV